jgi:hypothetical protein
MPLGFGLALRDEKAWHVWLDGCTAEDPGLVIPLDLDGDGTEEERVAIPGVGPPRVVAFARSDQGIWRPIGVLRAAGKVAPPASGQDWWNALRMGDYRTRGSGDRDVQLGGWRLGRQ